MKRYQMVEMKLGNREGTSVLEKAAHIPGPGPVSIEDLGHLGQVANAMTAQEAPCGAKGQLVAAIEADDERYSSQGTMTQSLERPQSVNLARQGHQRQPIQVRIDLFEDHVCWCHTVLALRRVQDFLPGASHARPGAPGSLGVTVQDDGTRDLSSFEQVAQQGGHHAAAGALGPNGGVVGVCHVQAAHRAQFLALDGRVACRSMHVRKRDAIARTGTGTQAALCALFRLYAGGKTLSVECPEFQDAGWANAHARAAARAQVDVHDVAHKVLPGPGGPLRKLLAPASGERGWGEGV